jgi:hypothetical protein
MALGYSLGVYRVRSSKIVPAGVVRMYNVQKNRYLRLTRHLLLQCIVALTHGPKRPQAATDHPEEVPPYWYVRTFARLTSS